MNYSLPEYSKHSMHTEQPLIIPQYSNLSTDSREIMANLSSLTSVLELKKANQLLIIMMDKNHQKYTQEISQAKEENTKMKEQVNHLLSFNYNYQVELQEMKATLSQNQSLINQYEAEKSQNTKIITVLQTKVEEKIHKDKFKDNKIAKLEKQLDEKGKEMSRLLQKYQKTVMEMKEEMEEWMMVGEKLDIAKNQKYQLDYMYDERLREVQVLREQNAHLVQKIDTLRNKLQTQHNTYQLRLREEEAKTADLTRQIYDQIQTDRRDAEDNSLCIICMDRKASRGVFPCGHVTYCQECVQDINACSLCKVPIRHKFQFFGKH